MHGGMKAAEVRKNFLFDKRRIPMKSIRIISPLVLLLVLMAACSQEPAEIHYGSDECEYCKMMITDNRFASQAVTETGKAIKFDAIECMGQYTQEHKSEMESAEMWVSNFEEPGSWVSLSQAQLVQSDVIKSPMGAAYLALPSTEKAKQHISEYPGRLIEWQDIVK